MYPFTFNITEQLPNKTIYLLNQKKKSMGQFKTGGGKWHVFLYQDTKKLNFTVCVKINAIPPKFGYPKN